MFIYIHITLLHNNIIHISCYMRKKPDVCNIFEIMKLGKQYLYIYEYIHIYTYVYIYIYICIYTYVYIYITFVQ